MKWYGTPADIELMSSFVLQVSTNRVGPSSDTVILVAAILAVAGFIIGFLTGSYGPTVTRSNDDTDTVQITNTQSNTPHDDTLSNQNTQSQIDEDLRDEVESVRSELADIDTSISNGALIGVQEKLIDLKPVLASAEQTAIQHNFDDLRDEIAALEQRREEHLREVTERVEAHPVTEDIPRAPDVSVNHDSLTDETPIGGGGNADVSKAILPTPDGDVTLAIKRPRMAGTLHKDAVERMLNEAETWDKLDDHDHIVGVVDYGSEPLPWIAMEYMDGGHLGERSGKMDVPQALWTAIATTKGVRHAHTRGVAHLDLKPENVLFRTMQDAWDVPKVADWGLSKHLLEHSKSVEGMSPHYAAPEQFETEHGPADNVTDVYQLGAVFYELLTGQPPFEGRPTQVMRAVMGQQPAPPSEVADVPEPVDDVLLTALAKERENRYDDIIYLRDDLQELFDDL